MDKNSLKKRYETTAETYERKGKREWAKAKNGEGDHHYGIARDAFNRAQRNRDKANNIE